MHVPSLNLERKRKTWKGRASKQRIACESNPHWHQFLLPKEKIKPGIKLLRTQLIYCFYKTNSCWVLSIFIQDLQDWEKRTYLCRHGCSSELPLVITQSNHQNLEKSFRTSKWVVGLEASRSKIQMAMGFLLRNLTGKRLDFILKAN